MLSLLNQFYYGVQMCDVGVSDMGTAGNDTTTFKQDWKLIEIQF